MSILERLGLVTTEESQEEGNLSGIPPIEEASISEAEPLDMNISGVSPSDIVKSVYDSSGLTDELSIYKIRDFINALPNEMTNSKKAASINGILTVSKINVDDLISDGNARLSLLSSAKVSIEEESNRVVSEAETDIENLKALIEAAESKISESKETKEASCKAIDKEIEELKNLLEFSSTVSAASKEDS